MGMSKSILTDEVLDKHGLIILRALDYYSAKMSETKESLAKDDYENLVKYTEGEIQRAKEAENEIWIYLFGKPKV